jgi:hypothetical protein
MLFTPLFNIIPGYYYRQEEQNSLLFRIVLMMLILDAVCLWHQTGTVLSLVLIKITIMELIQVPSVFVYVY